MKSKKYTLIVLMPLLLAACSHSIATEVEIEAPADRVWAELAAFDTYGDWNPFVRRLEMQGALAVGEGIEVEIAPPGGDPMVFHPVITEVAPGRVFEWEGQLLIPGIFTGRHRFELVELAPGKTLLKHSERFHGILVPIFDFTATLAGFEAMNAKLKERAEGK